MLKDNIKTRAVELGLTRVSEDEEAIEAMSKAANMMIEICQFDNEQTDDYLTQLVYEQDESYPLTDALKKGITIEYEGGLTEVIKKKC